MCVCIKTCYIKFHLIDSSRKLGQRISICFLKLFSNSIIAYSFIRIAKKETKPYIKHYDI